MADELRGLSGVAVDIDDRSLAAARRTLASYTALKVQKCSAYELPWTDEFDITFSIGVIHHLEFPGAALKAMLKATKPAGYVAIWVYGRENNRWLLWGLDPARKILFSRMAISWVHAISLLPTALLWLLLRCGLDRIEYFRLLGTLSFAHLRSFVFDQMLPRIANYWSRNEVEALARSRTGGRGNRADVSTRVRLRIGGVRKSSNNKTLGQSVKVV